MLACRAYDPVEDEVIDNAYFEPAVRILQKVSQHLTEAGSFFAVMLSGRAGCGAALVCDAWAAQMERDGYVLAELTDGDVADTQTDEAQAPGFLLEAKAPQKFFLRIDEPSERTIQFLRQLKRAARENGSMMVAAMTSSNTQPYLNDQDLMMRIPLAPPTDDERSQIFAQQLETVSPEAIKKAVEATDGMAFMTVYSVAAYLNMCFFMDEEEAPETDELLREIRKFEEPKPQASDGALEALVSRLLQAMAENGAVRSAAGQTPGQPDAAAPGPAENADSKSENASAENQKAPASEEEKEMQDLWNKFGIRSDGLQDPESVSKNTFSSFQEARASWLK